MFDPEETIIDFSKITKGDHGEKRAKAKRKGALYYRRLNYWTIYGWPKKVAEYLASEGIRLSPKNGKDRRALELIDTAFEKWTWRVNRRMKPPMNMSRKDAEEDALDKLVEANARKQRDPYNVFTLVSP